MFVGFRSNVFINKIIQKNFHNFYFTRGLNTKDIIKGECVQVYEASEWNEMEDQLKKYNYFTTVPKEKSQVESVKNTWINCVMDSQFKEKYFALLPFFMENAYSTKAKKRFVLKMDLYPETKYLKFQIALESGVSTVYEPLGDIIPLPPSDYQAKHLLLRSYPPQFIDMDMIYGNYKVQNMYCFDKQGTWIKEGVNHPQLLLENTYDENKWFNHYNWYNTWH